MAGAARWGRAFFEADSKILPVQLRPSAIAFFEVNKMAQPNDKKKPVVCVVRLEMPAVIGEYLDSLIASGLYGFNRSQAAERLLCSALEKKIGRGVQLSTRVDAPKSREKIRDDSARLRGEAPA